MPEEPEIETKELQDTIEELQEEREERAKAAQASAWTRYIALTTAFLAVFAAIGALQAGALVNEAMMLQLRASDKWNEYQADRQKDHLYTLNAYTLLDNGVKLRGFKGGFAPKASASATAAAPRAETGAHATGQAGFADNPSPAGESQRWVAVAPAARLQMYMRQVTAEGEKEKDLKVEAQKLESESVENMRLHERFAQSVTLIQVAVALSAIAALSKIKTIWWLSVLIGASGIIIFALAYLSKLSGAAH